MPTAQEVQSLDPLQYLPAEQVECSAKERCPGIEDADEDEVVAVLELELVVVVETQALEPATAVLPTAQLEQLVEPVTAEYLLTGQLKQLD